MIAHADGDVFNLAMWNDMAVLFSTFPVAQSIPEQFQLQVFDVKFPCVILPYESMT